jgi:hypothetical protein
VAPADRLRPRIQRDDAAARPLLARGRGLGDDVDGVRVDVVAGQPFIGGQRALPQDRAVADVARNDQTAAPRRGRRAR